MEPMGPHMGMYFWILYFRRKVDPLGESIRRLPGPLGGSDPTFVQQRLPPELPRAARATQYPFIPIYRFKNFQIFSMFFFCFFFDLGSILDPSYVCFPLKKHGK